MSVKTGVLHTDPFFAGGLNTFGYVGGNPLSWVDPLGLWTWGDSGNFPTVNSRDWANGVPHHDLNCPNTSVPPIPTGQLFDYQGYREQQRAQRRKEAAKRREANIDRCLENILFDTTLSSVSSEVASDVFIRAGYKTVGNRLIPIYGQVTGLFALESAAQCFLCGKY